MYAAPAGFKDTVGRHLPQFAGRDQQDNSEFLTALLDRLHEDLNQVRACVHLGSLLSVRGRVDDDGAPCL